MPIRELSDQRRLRAQFPIRLGERVTREDGQIRRLTTQERQEVVLRNAWPTEVDYFVMRPDEVPEEVRAAYGPHPKELRIMLPMEYRAQHAATGEEMVWSLNNRAFGAQRGILCRGTGLDVNYPGTAMSSDQAWAERVASAAGTAPEVTDTPYGRQFRIPCLGVNCVKYLNLVPGKHPTTGKDAMVKDASHDTDQSCKRVAALRFFVLDPTDPGITLGLAEITSSSINTMLDIPSDLDVVAAFTDGRTAGVPLTLYRKEKVTYRPKRSIHWPLRIKANQREAQRWALVPMSEAFLSEEQRLGLRQIEATPLAATFDSVRDLYPRGLPAHVGGNEDQASQEPAEAAAPATGDTAAQGGHLVEEADPDRRLNDTEIRELKMLAGGRRDPKGPDDDRRNPFTEEAQDRLRRFMRAYVQAHDLEVRELRFRDLTVGMRNWIRPRLLDQAPGSEPEVIDGDPRT